MLLQAVLESERRKARRVKHPWMQDGRITTASSDRAFGVPFQLDGTEYEEGDMRVTRGVRDLVWGKEHLFRIPSRALDLDMQISPAMSTS